MSRSDPQGQNLLHAVGVSSAEDGLLHAAGVSSADPSTGVSWRAVHAEVLRRIADRVWQPGDLIPGEETLAAEFGCARATVGRALRSLAEDGLLERRRRAGTRVAMDPGRKATIDVSIVRREVEAMGAVYGHRVVERTRGAMDQEAADRLGLGFGPVEDALGLVTLHSADGQPFIREERWINLAAAPGVLEEDFAAISANEWLVRTIPLSACSLSFTAGGASAEEAETFGTAPGDPLFVLERVTRLARRPITAARLAYRPGYRLETRL